MTTGTPPAVCVLPQLDPDDEEHPVSTAIPVIAATHSKAQVRVTR
jgi:hypothetical protein